MFITKRKHNDLMAQQSADWASSTQRALAEQAAEIALLEARLDAAHDALARIAREPNRPGILRHLRNIATEALDD